MGGKAVHFFALFTSSRRTIVFREYFAVKPGNSIALLQLQAPIAELSSLIFACSTDTDHGTLVGTCGMGSTSGTQHNYPTALQEIELKTNKMAKTFSVKDIWKREKCRDDVVCTTRTTKGSFCKTYIWVFL